MRLDDGMEKRWCSDSELLPRCSLHAPHHQVPALDPVGQVLVVLTNVEAVQVLHV